MKYSYKTKKRFGVLLVLLLASSNLLTGQTKKVLILGIDGCRQDALMAAGAPNVRSLLDHAVYSLDALTLYPTMSEDGWSTLLTGVTSSKHRGNDGNNSFSHTNYASYPNFLKRIENYNPALKTVSVVQWSPINDYINNNVDEVKTEATDAAVGAEVVNTLTNEDPDVLFVQFSDVDDAGHGYGFSKDVPQYMQAIEEVDGYIGNILTALRDRPNYANEDWLIVLSPDHGGTGFSHGGNTYDERNIFSIYYNKNFTPQQIQVLRSEPDTAITTSDTAFVHYFANKVNAYDTTHALDSYFGTSDFTIECRVRTASSTGDPAIIANKDWAYGTNAGFIIDNNYGDIKINIGDGAGHRTDCSGPAIADGAWHNIAMVVDRTNNILQLYVDDSLASSDIIAASMGALTSTYPLTVGQDGTGHYSYNYNFDGNIANVSVWNKALSATAVANHNDASENITSGDAEYGSLVGYWKGDDGSGSQLADSSPLGNPLLFNTTPAWVNSDTVITAGHPIRDTIAGSFVNFNNSYATISDPLYNFGTSSFTIECKVKTTNKTGDLGVVSNKAWVHGGNAGFIISSTNGNLKANIGDGSNRADVSGGSISDGNWHDVAMVVNREDSTLTVYADGLCVGQANIPASFGSVSTSYPLTVGQDGAGVYQYIGNIADIRIWNKAVRPVDILNKFYAPLTGTEDGLIGYWKADEGSGSTFIDASSSAKNLSLSPAAIWESSTAALINVAGNGHTIVPRMEDYAFSALTWMGVPIDPAWNLDGRSWIPADGSATPVDLVKFTGNYIADHIHLAWKVANEVNLKEYDIERSADGVSFTTTGTVKATGAGAYSYNDTEILQEHLLYYRLAAVNNDGTFKNSNIVSISVPARASDLKLYPNPASAYINLQMNSNINGLADIQITDVAGKIRLRQKIQIKEGKGKLNILRLSNGVYFVDAVCEQKHYTQKISVIK